MTLSIGSIGVRSDATYYGDGVLFAMFDDFYKNNLAPTVDAITDFDTKLSMIQGAVTMFSSIAQMIPYLISNGIVNPGTMKVTISAVDYAVTGTGTIS